MAQRQKQWMVYGTVLVLLAALATSCKPKCYDCIVTDPGTQQKDTLNTLCSDQPQYTSAYLQSWKVFCESSHGETVKRED